MSLATKVKKIKLDETDYLLTMDMRTIRYYKEFTGGSFLKAISKMDELDEDILFPMMGGMLRDVDAPGEPLGVECLENYDPIGLINYMTPYLFELINASMPKEKGGKPGKK